MVKKMIKYYRLPFLLIMAWLIVWHSAWCAPKLSTAECRELVMDLERMSNINPGAIEEKAPEVLEQLQNGETLPSYFIAYNIYVENLFNKGNLDKARQGIEHMVNKAFEQSDKECQVIALRSQGQFYFKLGLYERAYDCFKYAMELCPPYDSDELEHFFTWSSTLFWLVQCDIRTDRIAEANSWLKSMDEMMQWLEANGNTDRIGYKPVMIRGLKAKIELSRGNLETASKYLEECPQFIRDDIPARAYVEYYVAKMRLYVQQNKHGEALPLLDDLIDMHIEDFKPIAAEYIYQKGLSLAAMGRYEESTKMLKQYIDLKDRINEIAVAQQLDELTTKYSVEKLQHEHDTIRRRLLVLVAICAALIIIVALIVVNQRKLRRKNKILARNISEHNRLAREMALASTKPTDTEEKTDTPNLTEIGEKIIEYITQSQCYLKYDCSRDTIRKGVGVSDRILAKAISTVTGMSFVNYINQLRLNQSIELLEEKPEMTINEISTACGFGSVRQFQRLFKQCYDLTPSAFREARTESPD